MWIYSGHVFFLACKIFNCCHQLSKSVYFNYTKLHVEIPWTSFHIQSIIDIQTCSKANFPFFVCDCKTAILSFLFVSHGSSSLSVPKRSQRTWRWPSWRHARASVTSDERWATGWVCSVLWVSIDVRAETDLGLRLGCRYCSASVAFHTALQPPRGLSVCQLSYVTITSLLFSTSTKSHLIHAAW